MLICKTAIRVRWWLQGGVEYIKNSDGDFSVIFSFHQQNILGYDLIFWDANDFDSTSWSHS